MMIDEQDIDDLLKRNGNTLGVTFFVMYLPMLLIGLAGIAPVPLLNPLFDPYQSLSSYFESLYVPVLVLAGALFLAVLIWLPHSKLMRALHCPCCRQRIRELLKQNVLRRTRCCPHCHAQILEGRPRSVLAYRRMMSHVNRKCDRHFSWNIALCAVVFTLGTQLFTLVVAAIIPLSLYLTFASIGLSFFATFCTVQLWVIPSKHNDYLSPMLISVASFLVSLTFFAVFSLSLPHTGAPRDLFHF